MYTRICTYNGSRRYTTRSRLLTPRSQFRIRFYRVRIRTYINISLTIIPKRFVETSSSFISLM